MPSNSLCASFLPAAMATARQTTQHQSVTLHSSECPKKTFQVPTKDKMFFINQKIKYKTTQLLQYLAVLMQSEDSWHNLPLTTATVYEGKKSEEAKTPATLV